MDADLHVKIPTGLHRWLRHHAIDTGETLKEVVARSLLDYQKLHDSKYRARSDEDGFEDVGDGGLSDDKG